MEQPKDTVPNAYNQELLLFYKISPRVLRDIIGEIERKKKETVIPPIYTITQNIKVNNFSYITIAKYIIHFGNCKK